MGIFFHGEGSGLPSQELKTPRSVQLKLILDHYFIDKTQLQIKFISLNQDVNNFTESGQVFPTDWILKILKLRGHLDFVDRALKARASRIVLKSIHEV